MTTKELIDTPNTSCEENEQVIKDRISGYSRAVNKILTADTKCTSQKEANAILMNASIIDEEGNITPEFQNIFIKREGE